jgi:hypothetical protein
MRGARELSAECRLVFGSAHISPDMQAIGECLQRPLDWGRVITIAEAERATLVLWRVLSRADLTRVPPEAADRLRRSAMVYDFRMKRLESRLERTVGVLRERGVPVLLLKGAALAVSGYGGFTERPMSDLDLLIHPSDKQRARQAVIDAGWPETSDPVLHELLRDQHHMPPFMDPEQTGLRIELHTAFLPSEHPFEFDSERMWHGAGEAPARFRGASVPSHVHLLLHASLHFAWSHTMRFGAWRTFRDVSLLASKADLDWEALISIASRARAATSCYWTLRLAQRLSGADVPDDVLARLRPPTPDALLNALERHVIVGIAPGEGPPCPSAKLGNLLWRAALRPKWSGHAHVGRWDPDDKWGRALGRQTFNSPTRKLTRHARGIRHWWRFATRTLIPFD